MGRSESVGSFSTAFGDPDLVALSGLFPLDDWDSLLGLGSFDVEHQAVEQTLNDETLAMRNETPSLVESIVLLVLNDVLSLLGGGARHVNGLSGLLVDQQGGGRQLGVSVEVDGLESEHLRGSALFEGLVSQDTFEFEGLFALLVGVNVVVLMELVGSGLDGEELIAFLLSSAEVDFFLVFVHGEGGEAVDDFHPSSFLLTLSRRKNCRRSFSLGSSQSILLPS